MNAVPSIAHIDAKFFEYDRIEQRILSCSIAQVGGSTVSPFTRLYFGANKNITGKRIVSIDVNIPTNLLASPIPLNGGTILTNLDSQFFFLTMVDNKGEEVVKDLPLRTLVNAFNGGKRRIFDIIPNIERCYVTCSAPLGSGLLILFDFYTVDW